MLTLCSERIITRRAPVDDRIHSATMVDKAASWRSAEPFRGSSSGIVQQEEMGSGAGEEEIQGSLSERKRGRSLGIMKSASLVKVGYTVPSQNTDRRLADAVYHGMEKSSMGRDCAHCCCIRTDHLGHRRGQARESCRVGGLSATVGKDRRGTTKSAACRGWHFVVCRVGLDAAQLGRGLGSQ